jgi:DNA-binding response OmpR family regulator
MIVTADEKNFKIIIASENFNFRNILASKLRLEGFIVEFVTGGFHLLHSLENHKNVDMVILNEDMPDMPSHEVTSMLRTMKSKSELPIVFISKNGSEEEICDLILTGANEYIIQTANFQPIVERALKYFHLKKPHAA